jgi:outer membrane receptor protein involved in Fe transport
VPAALVELPEPGLRILSDPTGAFSLRGLEPGQYAVVVQRMGFSSWTGEARVENGRVTTLRVTLADAPVAIAGVEVVASGALTTGPRVAAARFDREEIRRVGARTAGDVARRAPGVVVREDVAGGAQTISIRGSEPDAVLVLLDGVPMNDPVTGVADLSEVPASAVELITVLSGAQSARYGGRAQAGVVLIETRAPAPELEARLVGGSLDEWSAGGEAGASLGLITLGGGGQYRRIGGEFNFPRVPGVDETLRRRINADVEERGGFLTAGAHLAGGDLRVRAGVDALDRGIPGQGYAPSSAARQEMDRVRSSLGWRRSGERLSGAASLALVIQRARYLDPIPPFGRAYDDETRARSWEARAELGGAGAPGMPLLRSWGFGIDSRHQKVDATSLSADAPRHRSDAGGFSHAALGLTVGGWDAELSAQLRLDGGRPTTGETTASSAGGPAGEASVDWFASHAVGVLVTRGPLALHVSNRSGYSPPSLGDQFFREGVAVAPNPDLRAERIPSEWEAGALFSGRPAGLVDASFGARAFQGDIRGMIVWAPDFRFVWSPRNMDIRRRGFEAWGDMARANLRLSGSWTVASVTQDREDADGAQLAYRPRHTAQSSAVWESGRWQAGVTAFFTGTRYPAAAEINALDPFWTVSLDLSHERLLGRTLLDTSIHVDRLFNEKDSLIFGFPEAGRRIRLEARARFADLFRKPPARKPEGL